MTWIDLTWIQLGTEKLETDGVLDLKLFWHAVITIPLVLQNNLNMAMWK